MKNTGKRQRFIEESHNQKINLQIDLVSFLKWKLQFIFPEIALIQCLESKLKGLP